MATSNYKLTYFDAGGITEPIRFLFHYGEIPFEDIRINSEEWNTVKPKIPFGALPILEHSGKTINQSIAIARYLAKKVKLTGNDEWEDVEIDAMVDTINDLRNKHSIYYWESNEEAKKAKKEELFNVTQPAYLKKLDEIAEKNNGHLALKRLTWADLFFAGLLYYMNITGGEEIIANYPNLKKVEENVLKIPSIKKWVEKRPKTEL